MIRTYEAHAVSFKGTVMEIKIHGGSTIIVPRLEDITDSTLLSVQMEPGAKEAVSVMTKNHFNIITTNQSTHKEHLEAETRPGPEFDTEPDWDCSLPDV